MCTAVVAGLVPSNHSAFDIYKPKSSPTYNSRFALKLRDDIGRAPLTTAAEENGASLAEPLAGSTAKRRKSFDLPRNCLQISDAPNEETHENAR